MLAEQRAGQRRTFTEQGRRPRSTAAATATIAEAGYRGASFAQIARRAGLSSTGLISYHFAGRDELIAEVAAKVIGDISAFMSARMAGVADRGGRAAHVHRGHRSSSSARTGTR